AKRLGAPVVPTVASKRKGLDDLVAKAVELMQASPQGRKQPLSYGESVDVQVTRLQEVLAGKKLAYPERWVAVKLLEGDAHVRSMVQASLTSHELQEFERVYSELAAHGSDLALEIVDGRYRFVHSVTNG